MSPNHKAARDSLTPEQQRQFDALVVDYKFAALTLCGSRMINYAVTAELVKLGWALTEAELLKRDAVRGGKP